MPAKEVKLRIAKFALKVGVIPSHRSAVMVLNVPLPTLYNRVIEESTTRRAGAQGPNR